MTQLFLSGTVGAMKTESYTQFLARAAKQRALILTLRDAGVPQTIIAAKLSISKQRVHQILNPKAKA